MSGARNAASAPASRRDGFLYWGEQEESAERDHAPDCKWRVALLCAIPIECPHGYDVCPECDPCTCGPAVETG